MASYPSRIICLTEETTETLYLLGQQDRIIGVSGYTVRPPEARQKPRVSAFINAKIDKIEAMKPDLVLAFSDLQAHLAAELVRQAPQPEADSPPGRPACGSSEVSRRCSAG
jgi:iron complex transport system substrate-binding protein